MKSLFDPASLSSTVKRIEKLTPETQPLWGKMNVSQMMEHCARALDYSTGKTKPRRLLIGILFGSFIKKKYYNDISWDKNLPTAPNFKMTDTPEFNVTKKRLLDLVKEFGEGGEAKCTRHPNAFFGQFEPAQHGQGQYKHLDHHLTQFGV